MVSFVFSEGVLVLCFQNESFQPKTRNERCERERDRERVRECVS